MKTSLAVGFRRFTHHLPGLEPEAGSCPSALAEEPGQLESWREVFSETDLDLLARVVRAEAEGEPYDGQVAVAAVILNRVKHPEFPNTIPGVVYEPLAFSVVANGTVNKPSNASAVQAAHAALNGWDPTGGAPIYIPTRRAMPGSAPHVLRPFGKHIFAIRALSWLKA